jgi:uncharacterized membrane protein
MFKIFLKERNFLLIICTLAFLSRVAFLDQRGLAGDEKYSLFVSQFVVYEGNNQINSVRNPATPYFTPRQFWSEKGTPDFLESIARLDTGNGALYTYTLHYWSNLFGNSDASLRGLSVLFNVLTLLLLYFFVKKLLKNQFIAVLTLFLATLSPFFIVFSQVARCYSMLFFWSLLATYLLVVNLQSNKQRWYSWLAYGITVLFCELCHVSTFPLFFVHGIFILIYHRTQKNVLIAFTISMVVPFLGMVGWLTSYGGKWMFEYVANSTKVYNHIATHSPEKYLKTATPKHIIEQLYYLFSSFFITTEGLYRNAIGLKNLALALVTGTGFIATSMFIKDKRWLWGLNSVLLLLPLPFYSLEPLSFLVFSVNLFFIAKLLYFFNKEPFSETKKGLVLLVLIIVVMFVSIVAFAVKDGNTFRLMPRYIGYAYSFGLIFVAWGIFHLRKIAFYKVFPIWVGLFFQFYFILHLVVAIYKDTAPRYFMEFAEPRQKNPYLELANQINTIYSLGDTIIYPSYFPMSFGGVDMPTFSAVDAQLVNFYLPKKADYLQRIDKNEANKVILKKENGSKIVLFDFKNNRYRY